MALTVATRNDMLQALKDACGATPFLSQHSDEPDDTGSLELAGSTREPFTWGVPAGGSMTGSDTPITVPAGLTAKWVGYWTAAVDGTFVGASQLSAIIGEGDTTVTPTETQN